jgi:Tol biopolymer transport system component
VLAYNDGLVQGFSISSAGAAVYGLNNEDSNLWAVDWPPARDAVRLTDGRRNFRAVYSRESRVAYVKAEVGEGFSVWTMRDDGSQQERLVPDSPGFSPQWSPDGTRLLVRKTSGPEDNTFAWVDAATRRSTPVVFSGANMGEVRLSPKGDAIAFHVIDESGVLNVWTQPLAGGPRRQITFDNEAISYPSWSPDGRWIAAEVKRGTDTFVVVLPSQGGKVEQLTFDRGQSWPNAWSPDGEWIAFAAERAAVWNLWAVSRLTHETRQLTHFKGANGYVRWPTWSPRGDRIIFERNQVHADVWLTQLP